MHCRRSLLAALDPALEVDDVRPLVELLLQALEFRPVFVRPASGP